MDHNVYELHHREILFYAHFIWISNVSQHPRQNENRAIILIVYYSIMITNPIYFIIQFLFNILTWNFIFVYFGKSISLKFRMAIPLPRTILFFKTFRDVRGRFSKSFRDNYVFLSLSLSLSLFLSLSGFRLFLNFI